MTISASRQIIPKLGFALTVFGAAVVGGPAKTAHGDPFDCPTAINLLENIEDHYDPDALFDTGPEVLEEAKNYDVGKIALLGRYFEGGERGFPKNENIGFCLKLAAYSFGYSLSSLELARKYEEIGDYENALMHYSEYFAYVRIMEASSIRRGITDPFKPNITGDYHAFFLLWRAVEKGRIRDDLAEKLFLAGYQKGAEAASRLYGKNFD